MTKRRRWCFDRNARELLVTDVELFVVSIHHRELKELEAAMRVAAAQRSVATTEAGSGTRHGFRAIVRHVIRGGRPRSPRDDAASSLEGDAAAAADRDALEAYVVEPHNTPPTDRQQWDARERQARRSSTSVIGSPNLTGSPKGSSSHGGSGSGSKKAEKRSRRHSCSALSPQQLELAWDASAGEGLGEGLAAMLPPHDLLTASSLDSPPPAEPLRVRRGSSALSLSTSSTEPLRVRRGSSALSVSTVSTSLSADAPLSSLSSPATPGSATATFPTDARGLRRGRRRSSTERAGASGEDSARKFPEVRSPPPGVCSSPEPPRRRSSVRRENTTQELWEVRTTI